MRRRRRRGHHVPHRHRPLVPRGHEPAPVGGEVERSERLAVRFGQSQRLLPRGDVEEHHLVLAHHGEAGAGGVEAQGEAAADGDCRHFLPCAGAVVLPEAERALTVAADRRRGVPRPARRRGPRRPGGSFRDAAGPPRPPGAQTLIAPLRSPVATRLPSGETATESRKAPGVLASVISAILTATVGGPWRWQPIAIAAVTRPIATSRFRHAMTVHMGLDSTSGAPQLPSSGARCLLPVTPPGEMLLSLRPPRRWG